MAAPSTWLRHAAGREEPAATLLCLAHAGGGASSFNGWRAALPDWVHLVKVQLPGREDRRDAPLVHRLEELLPALFREVRALASRPLALYGNSMGALVAFELARELRRQGLPRPAALFVSSRRAPHRPVRREHLLHHLPDEVLVDRLYALGGFPPDFLQREDRRGYYLPIVRADLGISDGYAHRPEAGLESPLHAFIGEGDDLVARADWEAWSELAGGEFSRAVLPGRHFLDREGQAALIAFISRTLAAAAGRSAGGRSTLRGAAMRLS